MYIAVAYIGSTYVPGEIISEDTPKEKLDWLKRAGAIREAAPDPEAPVMADTPEDNEQTAQAPDPEAPVMADTPEDNEQTAQAPDPEPGEQEVEAPEEEIDEEAEAPEIDVMDGIVSSAEKSKPEETATKTTSKGRKKA